VVACLRVAESGRLSLELQRHGSWGMQGVMKSAELIC
jgi:hypothetical protein